MIRPAPPRAATVLVAMSGGVDSSVTAALLSDAGYQAIGATIKTFCYGETDGPTNTCCGLEGIADARSVASRLDFPHFVADLAETFAHDVIDNFVSEYSAGRTPIPCVRCNSFTKFRDLVQRADTLGCEYVATGHYARIETDVAGARLCLAEDASKDQTYFLWGVPRSVLDRLLLPIGDLQKEQVRAIARDLGLVTAEKPESFEICFVPDNDYAGVLRRYLNDDHPALTAGPFLLEDGTEVGEHDGYARFTVGQRKRVPGGFGEPMYVVRIAPERRAVVLGPLESLAVSELEAEAANWLAEPPRTDERLGVRIRHGAPIVDCTVRSVGTDRFGLELPLPQRAVTPGQSAVLYRGKVVVGGGTIV